MQPKIVLLEDYGVEVTLDGEDPVVMYGGPDMTAEDLVERAITMKNPTESFVVKKPGDIVIEVPKFTAKAEVKTPSAKKGD